MPEACPRCHGQMLTWLSGELACLQCGRRDYSAEKEPAPRYEREHRLHNFKRRKPGR